MAISAANTLPAKSEMSAHSAGMLNSRVRAVPV
jgi:hypothetical protein